MVQSKRTKKHHKLQPHALRRLEGRISSLTEPMKSDGNPFKTASDKLFNLVTKKVLPQKSQEEICQQPQIGQTLYETFCRERILSKEVNFWSTLSSRNVQTWCTNLKKFKVKTRLEGNIVELSADSFVWKNDNSRQIVTRNRPP